MNNSEMLALLKPEAARVDEAMRNDLSVIENPELVELIHHAVFNGGKRIRPLLTVLASRLRPAASPSGDGETNGDVYRLAAVFEYLHAASLLHDDVIDQADKRRGRPSANAIWGNTAVILAGDFLHARAMLLAGTIGGSECLRLTAKATSAMVEAEFLQMRNAREMNQSEQSYFQVLRGKTAALISTACEAGIIHSKSGRQERAAMHAYGAGLGLAFQIVDDLLDYLGDSGKTGKATGNDFTEGKITLPLIHALAHSGPADRAILMELLAGGREKRASSVDTACRLIEKYQGYQYARKIAQDLIDSAVSELNVFGDSQDKDILICLASYVLTREK